MNSIQYPGNLHWSTFQKLIFRFFFILVTLYVEPWGFLNYIPGSYSVMQYYYQFDTWCVEKANALFFHVREVLVPMNGSGDTSFGYAQLELYLWLAFIGTIIWTALNRKARNYNALSYWTRLFTRYFLIENCILYGIDKIFLLQMPFPSTSQLATPLGDFLPMRLSWMFMGYSSHYQIFSGVLETLAGCLLLFRRTTTLGLFFCAGIFLNVAMLNLGYDIPVKLFSIELLILSLFLLSFEAKRIISFFIFNRASEGTSINTLVVTKRWMRISRIVLKLAFIILAMILPSIDMWTRAQSGALTPDNEKMPSGVYTVTTFARNNDTISCTSSDSLFWKDVIIDSYSSGSVNTRDTLFRSRYGRGYFNFRVDEKKQTIDFSKNTYTVDSIFLFQMKYTVLDTNRIQLNGKIGSDSVLVSLKRIKRHFPLAERQFHWLSEYNR